MSLSVASRRRFQTNASSAHTAAGTSTSSSGSSVPLGAGARLLQSVRKQHSFIEPASKYTAQQRGYLSRGLSVGRSIENIRQKLYHHPSGLSRQSTLSCSQGTTKFSPSITSTRLRDKNLANWSSTSSLLNHESGEPKEKDSEGSKNSTDGKTDGSKADKNRINLNIVLAQTIRATTEQDIDSATESETPKHKDVESSVASTIANPTPLSVSPNALTVQRRPPLVRAMSAPVRGLDDKIAANKRNQQKLRRRKIFTRTASSVTAGGGGGGGGACDGSSSLLVDSSGGGTKKALNRARSVVVAPEIITLVSLLSSEGSDSEREDNSTASTPSGAADKQSHVPGPAGTQRSPQRRAPLLRKTGKSVSFQDSYPPTFQLASKEYSHMIRRGSIAPLAARIRSNRPPTAPPVSIFLSNESTNSSKTLEGNQPDQQQQQQQQTVKPSTLSSDEAKKENNNNAANCNVQQDQQDYNYPLYVRSVKERECWKLFQKMCAKGVTVSSFDTVLRGMLTPTEFRHFQKQREHEEAKAQKEAEAEAEAAALAEGMDKELRKGGATAIERLSESLLQSK
ncbi:uncharacterized protein [Drosophila tropicalis]|uniref:uncharacterized protein n=1 Tax=Drosophila tropicalis TaxID=46794 RepID=UPI0035AB8E4D